MSENDRIIENVCGTMYLSDMPLQQEDKDRMRECLEGKVSFEVAIETLIRKYIRE